MSKPEPRREANTTQPDREREAPRPTVERVPRRRGKRADVPRDWQAPLDLGGTIVELPF